MTSHEHSKFVMAAQQREQSLLTYPQANEKNEAAIHRSDHPSHHALAAIETMPPPGIDMGSNDGSLGLSGSPDNVGDRKRRAVANERDRSPRRAAITGRRSNRSIAGRADRRHQGFLLLGLGA